MHSVLSDQLRKGKSAAGVFKANAQRRGKKSADSHDIIVLSPQGSVIWFYVRTVRFKDGVEQGCYPSKNRMSKHKTKQTMFYLRLSVNNWYQETTAYFVNHLRV